MSQKKSGKLSKKKDRSEGTIDDIQPIVLPPPKFGRAADLFSALKKRKTVRTIRKKKLSLQMLSNLLWAAWGVNRKKGPFGDPGRTAASASNSQEIDLYVAMADGIYLYEVTAHTLMPVVTGDFRALAIGPGQQEWGKNAPVRLIYVVDIDKFSKAGFQEPGLYNTEIQKSYYYVATGLIAENVYLFAAAQGLAAWFHNCNKPALVKALKLRSGQRPLFGQTVGYPGRA
jgi:nitroreductase